MQHTRSKSPSPSTVGGRVKYSGKKRKVVSAIILAVGFFLAFLLVLGSSSSPQKPLVSVVSTSRNDSGFQTDGSGGFFNLDPLGTSTSAVLNENLTSELAQNYVKNISNLNAQSPPSATGTLTMPAPGAINDALTQALSGNLEVPEFTEKNIKIGSDNATTTQITYIEEIASISQKDFSGFSTPLSSILENYSKNNDTTALLKYTTIMQNVIHDLLAVEVPPQLAPWHLQNLNLWEKKLVVFSALLNSNSDPLKAALAIQEVPLVIQDTYANDKVINGYMKSL